MHRPSILFLDEPTAGLDTQSRHILWDIVRDLRNAVTMVFLTTHYMDEAEALCDRVAIIDGGKIIAEGSPTFLNELVGKIAIDYEIDGKGTTQTFSTRDEAREFITAHLPPESTYSLRKTTPEDVFLKLTGNHMRGAKDVQEN